MARYRTVKPEFWTSEQVMECSPIARLMFIGMWNYADDSGRLPLSPKTIKAQIFPSDDISVETIRGMIDELSANGLVRSYIVDDKEYLLITGWHHQKIDKPQKPKYPEPPANSENVRRMLAPEEKGKEEKVEKIDSEAKASGADAPSDPSIPERDYFLRGREVLGKGQGALIAKLLKSKGANVSLARAAIEQASQKQNPTEYVAAICRGPPAIRPNTAHQQERQTGREILNDIGKFISGGGSSETDIGILRHDSSDGPESIRGRLGGDLV